MSNHDSPSANVRNIKWKPPRETIHNGITMRSRLEAGFAQWCDSHRVEWKYEPYAVSGARGQWLPDFVIDDARWLTDTFEIEHIKMLVEVKPEKIGSSEILRLAELGSPELAVLATPHGLFQMIDVEYDDGIPDGGLLPIDIVRYWRGPTECDIAFAYAEQRVEGPWQGEWWRR